MASSSPRPLSCYFGGALLAAAFFLCFRLSAPLPAQGITALCFLLLAVLALLLIRREAGSSHWSLALLPVAIALLLRILCLDHATLDYQDFLSRWVEYFRQHGGFLALKDPVGNYNVPYLYLLAFLSYLPYPDLYGIKLFSILFDILLAWGGARLAKCLTKDDKAPLLVFCALLLLPTVVLNGACWGQCDSVWAALCVHALACALKDKPLPSMILLAVAFSFKLQAIFIIPLWCALWFCGRIQFRYFFAFPAAFFLSIAPALLMGKPLGDVLSIYLNQAGDSVAWQTVNYNSPSVFSLLPWRSEIAPWVPKAAILCAFLFMFLVLALLFARHKAAGNAALAVAGAALSLGIPFFLPYMHERYFFLGGVLLAVLACVRPALLPAALGAEAASLGGYHAYLRQRYFLVLSFFGLTWTQLLEGICMAFALGAALLSLWKLLHHDTGKTKPEEI